MIETAVSSLAHQAIDATTDRLHDTTDRLQDVASKRNRKPHTSRKHRTPRMMLFALVLGAIGVGVWFALQRRAQSQEQAPDAFGDAVQREYRGRDFASTR